MTPNEAPKNGHKIGFVGIDEKVFYLLCASKEFEVVCTNLIADFFKYPTINVFDYLFKVIYFKAG